MGEKKLNNEMLDKKDVAAHFGVTIRAIEGWMKKSNMPYFKIGSCVRFDIGQIEKWKKQRQMNG